MATWTEFASVSFAAGLAIKSMVVLAVAWLVRWAFGKQSAAMRHAVWTTAFVSLAALLALSVWLPALEVRVPTRLLGPATFLGAASNAPTANHAGAKDEGKEPIAGTGRQGPRQSRWLSAPIGSVLLLLWACGLAASLAPVVAGWIAMWRLRRASSPLESDELADLARQLGLTGEPPFLEGPMGSMPMTAGVFRPAVFLPRDAREWCVEQRRAVLLHELAHVRRRDSATHLLARFVVSCYWWNPLAWAAWREFVKERERAADDSVLSAGSRPTEYAQHLLNIARAQRLATGLGAAAVAMARRSQLEGRLFAILDNGVKRTQTRLKVTLGAGVLALALVVPLAAMRIIQADEEAPRQAQDRAQEETLLGGLTVPLPADLDAVIGKALAEKQPPATLDQLADKAVALGEFDAAQKLLEAALKLRAESAGENSQTIGVGIRRLGDLFRDQGLSKNDAAKKRYTEAAALLSTGAEAATTLIRLGTVELSMAQQNTREGKPELAGPAYAEGVDDFERARTADAAGAGGQATMWEALAAQWQGETVKADELFRKALSIQKSDPAGWLPTAELYAQLLDEEGNTEPAKTTRDQAAEMRKTVAPRVLLDAPGREEAVKIGGSVTPPRIESKIEPQYSAEARIAKYQGTVVAFVEIGSDGFVHSISIQRGLGLGLDEKAAEAIARWKFKPAEQNGQPLAVQATIEVNFRLF